MEPLLVGRASVQLGGEPARAVDRLFQRTAERAHAGASDGEREGAREIEGREALRRLGQKRLRRLGRPPEQLDRAAHVRDLRAYPRARGQHRGPLGERQGVLEPAGEKGILGGHGEAARGCIVAWRQLGRALEGGGGGRVPASGPCPGGAALELGRHGLVGPLRGRGAMPGAPVGAPLPVDHLGQRLVRLAPLRERRRAVDRRANEGMPERNAPAHGDQAGGLRRAERRRVEPERRRRRQHRGVWPASSVVAISSTRWVSGGRRRTLPRNASSRPRDSGGGSGIGSGRRAAGP